MSLFRKRKIYVWAALLGLLVFLSAVGWFKPLDQLNSSIMNPVVGRFFSWGAAIRRTYNRQTEEQTTEAEIARLQGEVERLTVENAALNMVAEENDVLREHLQFFDKHDYKYLLSHVISRGDILSVGQSVESIIIDEGERDGVSIGLAVINGQGVIVGKVAEVKDHTAYVQLANSRQCKLAATLLNDEKTSGVTVGELGLTIRMEFIPQTKTIEAGDTVVTSGLEEAIPRGLVIGRVTAVNRESNDVWQTAQIAPLADVNDLTIVAVLLP